MVINTKNTNYSSGGMLIKYHPFGEVISVLIDNYYPLGGVISVLSVNSFSILSFITSYSFIYSIEEDTD